MQYSHSSGSPTRAQGLKVPNAKGWPGSSILLSGSACAPCPAIVICACKEASICVCSLYSYLYIDFLPMSIFHHQFWRGAGGRGPHIKPFKAKGGCFNTYLPLTIPDTAPSRSFSDPRRPAQVLGKFLQPFGRKGFGSARVVRPHSLDVRAVPLRAAHVG